MKLSEIKKLYTKTAIAKLDANFFKELYRVCVDAIESIADTIIFEKFSEKTSSNENITQLRVYLTTENKKIGINFIPNSYYGNLIGTGISIANKENFDFHDFVIWISCNPNDKYICIQWGENGFDFDLADKIFGEYIIKKNNNSSIWVSLDFFNS